MSAAANFVTYLVITVASLVLGAASLEAQGRRVALVIGNSEYVHAPTLKNPRNDAADLAASLEGLGFDVTKGIDLDKPTMERVIRDFAGHIAGASAALLFYAGHGLQVSGQNYLVPVDAKLSTAAALDFELIPLDLVHKTLEREARTNILILDACRDNPLARNLARAFGTRSIPIGRGLAGMESGEGSLIAFSTQPGNVALDGEGRNSPFAKALLAHIAVPGDDLQTILINVRNDVMAQTEHRQIPWEHSALTARFFFSEPKAALDQQNDIAAWNAVKDSADPAVLRTYLQKFPVGHFAAVARNLITALEKQQEMANAVRNNETGRPPSTPEGAVPPAKQGSAFDGSWSVEITGLSKDCGQAKRGEFPISILGGQVSGNRQTVGQASDDGRLRFQRRASSNRRNLEFTASLNGNSGKGQFLAVGTTCTGTVALKRSLGLVRP